MAFAPRLSRLSIGLFIGLLAVAGALMWATPTWAAGCASFGDPGCFFGEDFESFAVGQIPGTPWAYNNGGTTPGTSVQSPGLNGTGKRLLMGDGSISAPPYGCVGCPRFSAPITGTAAIGSTYWVEFWLTYEAGYKWQCGINCSNKTMDWRANCCSGNQRVLLTVWQAGDVDHGHLMVSMYPNYDQGGSDPGTITNRATEKFANVTDVLFTAGNTYHIVFQVTVGNGLTGAYKVWINGTLTHDFSGLQTSSNANGWPWDSTELGGPGWDVQGGGHVWGLDQIRFTTTNIAAADDVPPPPPASLNATATGQTTTSLSWSATTDSAGVTGYRVERCPGNSCANFVEIGTTAGVTSYPDSGLSAGSAYRYRVRASDAIGNLSGYSPIASTTTLTPADTTPPSVVISAPAPSATLSGVTQVTVAASDNTGVASLKYYLDGVLIGVVSPPSPTFALDTTTFPDGPHTLGVTAADGAGNVASAAVAVTIRNQIATTTSINAPPISGGANAAVTVSVAAAGAIPTGSIALVVDGAVPITAPLVNGQAIFSLTAPSPGVHVLVASYSGQGSFSASSASGTLSVGSTPNIITSAPTATTMTVSAPSISQSSKILVSVKVSAASGTPGGSVTLVVDNGASTTATLFNGWAQFTVRNLSVGDHTLALTYVPQVGYLGCSATASTHVNGKSRSASYYRD